MISASGLPPWAETQVVGTRVVIAAYFLFVGSIQTEILVPSLVLPLPGGLGRRGGAGDSRASETSARAVTVLFDRGCSLRCESAGHCCD